MYLYVIEKVVYSEDLDGNSGFRRRRSEDSDGNMLLDVYNHQEIQSATQKQN